MKQNAWKDYLKAEDIKALYAVDGLRLTFDSVIVWFLILASLALFSATGSFLIFVVAVFVIAVQQHHLTTFVHEAAHNNIISGKKTFNDALSDVIYAGPILVTTASYRNRHAEHHKHLGVAGVDDETNDRHLISPAHVWKNICLCLSGIRAARSFFGHTQASQNVAEQSENKGASLLRHYGPICFSNCILLVWCMLWGNVFAYFFLWLAPLATVTTLLVMLRVIVEHQGDEYSLREEEDFESDIPNPVTRTIDPPFIEKWIFGPLNFCYHHEHHLLPAIPYTNLPKLHKLLKESGYYRDNSEYLEKSYISVLREKLAPETIRSRARAV